jgi:hypothetical protein
MGIRMTPEEEAHWRYQLELMTNWGISSYGITGLHKFPDEVAWLREEARYHCHLANAYNKRQQTFVTPMMNELP